MMYSNRVCQKLHDEHMATLALLERLERFVAKGEPAAASDSGTRSFLIDLAVAFESEVWHHFDFEEKHLFDYLVAAGDTELARHLTDEHVQIKTVGQPSSPWRVPRRWHRFQRLPGASSARYRSSSSSS